jgi:hypothetical protein
MRMSLIAVFGVACYAASTPAIAGSNATGSARITATVPEVCDISANQFVADTNGTFTGIVQEFCNSSNSYQIVAIHRPLSIDEEALVGYGGIMRNLDPAGLSFIAFRAGQRVENVNVVIDAREIEAPLSVAFTMSPV